MGWIGLERVYFSRVLTHSLSLTQPQSAPRSHRRSSTRSPCAPPPNPAAAPPPCTPPATAPSIPAAGPDLDDAAGPDLEDAAGPVLIDYLHLFCYPSQGKTRFVGALVLIGLGQFLVGGFGDGTRGCSWISSLCFTCRSVSSHLVSSDQALALVLSLLLVLRKTKDPMASRYKSDTSLTDLLSSLL